MGAHLAGTVGIVLIVTLAWAAAFTAQRRLRKVTRNYVALATRHALCQQSGDNQEPGTATAAASMMIDIREVLSPIGEAAAVERAQREAEGWSPSVAEQMGMLVFAAGANQFLKGAASVAREYGA
jgi:hypothetical protein